MIYGDNTSRAILSNLSYQFFGKANDPYTAEYYERFFELVKRETTSISRGHNLDFDTRITTGERKVSKIMENCPLSYYCLMFDIGKFINNIFLNLFL